MEFRDLKRQYHALENEMNAAVGGVMEHADFIMGHQVAELERKLEEYVGVRHCVTCANGTDALEIALMAWEIGEGDAVFVPDFTFFSSAEVIASVGAVPVFVDVCRDTFNISPDSLAEAVEKVRREGKLVPRAVIAVDLFGLPASHREIRKLADRYGLRVLEDGAQGFGGRIGEKRACSFGDINTTSFFPAKPLGCYGDGGAIFTDDDILAERMRSLRVHGRGADKYDNVSIGKNSRLDTMQAAVLKVKLQVFPEELERVNAAAVCYHTLLEDMGYLLPSVPENYYSSWAQYTILLPEENERDKMQKALKSAGIPAMVYYKKGMHQQRAFAHIKQYVTLSVSEELCGRVLSLPIHPYLTEEEQQMVAAQMKQNG